MQNPVFARRSSPLDRTLSAGVYNLVIGLTLCWGFWINWWMVGNIPVESIRSIHPWLFVGGYFASCLTGAWLFHSSDKPWVSFLGYNLVVVPFGLIVNLVVSRYDSALVYEAIRITALVTLGMMLLGTLFPRFFASIASALTIALLLVIVVELVEVFILGIHHGVIDWIVVLIFCGYVGVDWGRANQIPKTLDNAIDSAAALYMDIINLFLRILRILRILGRK
ncbi:hypothetical protein EGJ08_01880 [Stutzerimonas stutzeri]|uniref:Bax inhibitor-1 family protein n=1 Tax=Stutzerimonas stutzeri TaxID=316 RepID=UPI00066BAABD|nr:Bax inhibitor-1 family protein [Stutzerimonas stutzeri]MCQ4227155.1 Bax inhibitor-1 family protein [Stutzerimonas stutzeri]MDH0100306.1 Bax inhibitor-1 family protein [Stutzerimonas stutzeri]QXP26369.1 Bax inhibitor-1 family protein [Stutzerimonas stutzeri]RRV62902.1 hypothetical protein EGJ08_01880 [Stutzerimonas stutzeri]RRV65579.1 hypothetical protein EGJ07_05800 [Stutzerimonas stutzeri]